MRTISAAALAKVTQQYGSEPLNIVEIQWAAGGPRAGYADKDIAGTNIKGRIVDLSGLDFVINVSDGSDSAELSLKLSDIDGDLKHIIDNNDIHKRDVWVYQWYQGISVNEKFLVFRGEVNSPIVWNEGDRTLSFSVVSKIEDAEIGFSIEEGQFTNPPQELIGKPWPLKFGTTINVPALRLKSPREGVLATGVGISDFTLPFRISAAEDLICPVVFRGFTYKYVGAPQLTLQITPSYVTDEGCVLSQCTTIRELQTQLTEQRQYEFTRITIIGGERFPQDQQITLNIDGGKFTGTFIGTEEAPSNIFEIVSREHPDEEETGVPTTASVNAAILAKRTEAIALGCPGASGGDLDGVGGVTVGIDSQRDDSRINVEASEKSFEFYNAIPKANFFWANPGSTVTLDGEEEIVYVTNLLPETIHRVAAFRTFENGVEQLVTVPPSFYTVRTTDYSSYDVTEVVFSKPLSRFEDGWDDEIYITSTSTVGPNTVDIMTWLIEKYTDHTIDSTSFNAVRTKLEPYPMDFPYLDRRDILKALQELAFQARCAIYLRDDRFYLKYLPEAPDSVATITESDLDEKSLEIFHSNTEDIVTKLVAEWKRDYSIDDPNKVILRHNVIKYGTQEQIFDFYAFNELDYVHKSASFWLIRKSNTWRQLRFKTPLHLLKLETFDGVTINLHDFAPGTITALVQKANYESNSRLLEFEIWTPVKSGTQVAYDFAYPAAIDQTLQWPTEDERNSLLIGSGDAPGFSTTPPSGHTLSSGQGGAQGFQFGPCESQGLTTQSFVNQTCGGGNGDTYPSDIGDTAKEKDLVGSLPPDNPVDPGEINVGTGPVPTFGGPSPEEELSRRLNEAEQKAAQAQATANAANEAAGGEGSGSAAAENPPDGSDLPSSEEYEESVPEGESLCLYYVNCYMHDPTVLIKHNSDTPGDWNFSLVGTYGASQHVRTDKWGFKTCAEAQRFAQGINDYMADRMDMEDIGIDEILPVAVTTICPSYDPACPEWDGVSITPETMESFEPNGDPATADNTDYASDAAPFMSLD